MKFRVSRQSLIKNRLVLSSSGVQMKWHVRYYDNLGDMFDVVNTNNQYTVNRNDLVDFSNINSNLFEPNAESHQQHQQRIQQVDITTKNDGGTNSDSSVDSSSSASSSPKDSSSTASIVANAPENSFTLRTIDRGVFLLELSPAAAIRRDLSRDYIGLQMSGGDFESAGGEFDSMGGRSRLDVQVGDLICLSRQHTTRNDENDSIDNDDDGKREKEGEREFRMAPI